MRQTSGWARTASRLQNAKNESDFERDSLQELRELSDDRQRHRAAAFTLEESGEEERRLLMIVSAVYRKLRNYETGAYRNAPGEKFLIELIELAGNGPLHFYAVHDIFRDFDNNWQERANAMRLGREDEQDPDDEDHWNNAESARIERLKRVRG